jgi:hypothetical protein
MLKYFSNAAKLVALIGERKRSWMTELYIYTGVAGTGKSHAAHVEGQKYLDDNNIAEEPYDLMVPSKGQKLWFQNYSGESVVIIDDFYGTISIDDMKRLIDKYPCKVENKNGHTEFLAKRVYITSNVGWRNWWGSDLLANANNEEALTRRITVDRSFTQKYVAPILNNPVMQIDDIVNENQLQRQNAIVGPNVYNELFCDEEADFLGQNLLSDGELFFRDL